MFVSLKNNTNWSSNSNEVLWTAFKRDERGALTELFSRFYPRLFRYGIKLGAEEEIAKDVIQELFLNLWRNRHDLGNADSVEFYLLVSFKRMLFREIKRINKKDKKARIYNEDLLQYEESPEKKIILLELKEEKYQLYQKALLILTGRQREALRLRLEFGLDNQEIAEIMGLSEKSIRNLIYEATKTLKTCVARFEKSQSDLN